MDMNPVVDGAYLESDLSDLAVNLKIASESIVFVIDGIRVELCGKDLKAFICRFNAAMESISDIEGLDDEQRSFMVFRKMLVSDGLLN